MKFKTIMLAFLLCGFAPFLFAQEKNDAPVRCDSDKANLNWLKNNPKEAAAHRAFNIQAKAAERSGKGFAAKATYTIPVVVHVFGKTQSGKTVDYAKVKRAIEVVNEDFNGQNPDFNTVDPFFRNRRSTLNIEFALAKIDPNGGSTNGVIFHPYIEKGFGADAGYDDKIASYSWDNYKYMNVYIMNDLKNDGQLNRSGVAWFPNTAMSNAGTARVVYNGRYLHGNTDTEFASIFSHEFGHWLNLYHTFTTGGCSDTNGDYVSDTPQEDENATNRGCVVGASECGNLINYENYMGYESSGGCAKMFTAGQVSRMTTALNHAARRPLWQSSNLTATGVGLSKASLLLDDYGVEEAVVNNGTLADVTYYIDLEGGTFTQSSGAMSQGTHFDTSLPSGVTVSITAESNTRLRVKFGGKATSHAVSNNVAGTITFRNAAITGGTSRLNVAKVAYNFSFFDPYKVIYENIPDETATASAVWQPFTIKAGNTSNQYGAFYENNNLRLETYTKALVSQSGTRNVTLLQANQLISDASNWVNSLAHPDLHDVETSSYTVWRGRTAYVGFQLEMYPGKVNYGWMRVRVNSAGTEISVLDYAYSTKPNGAIKAGSQTLEPDEPTCTDGIQNGDETGVDCGGTSCSPCQVDPTCTDGIQNGNETGIDCGGDCAPCQVDPTCTDGIQNGNETGIDCGGDCAPCNTNVTYCDASTSTSGTLHITNVKFGSIDNTSTNASYNNFTNQSTNLTAGQATTLTVKLNNDHWTFNAVGVWIDWNNNGDFTDAGEKVYSRFAAGPYSGSVTPPSGAVSNTSLRMRVRVGYGSESKITPCGTDTYIGEVEDYTIRVGGTTTPTCTDGIQNGDETGVDCGGTSCAPCQVDPTCTDGIQNGNETGVDCGGDCAPCQVDPTCTDGIQNGNETGVDCGGDCAPCQVDVTYCSATGNAGPEGVSNVTFAGINNSSVRNASGYDDFTSISASVSPGSNHNLRVTIIGYQTGSADEIYAFFDWNQDGDFSDSGEKLTLTKTTNLIGDISVAVPSTAKAGSTRMRLLVSYYDNESNPCDTGSNDVRYGEYEDYTVNVTASKSAGIAEGRFSVITNPIVNQRMSVDYGTNEVGRANVQIFSISGRKVAEYNQQKGAERVQTIQLDRNFNSGLFIARIQFGNKVEMIKIGIE